MLSQVATGLEEDGGGCATGLKHANSIQIELGPSVLLRVWLQKECSPRNEEWKNKEKGGQIPEITQHSSA